MLRRHIEPSVRTACTQYPVVTVTGPRQSGKTTLVRALFPDYDYVSLESPDDREFAQEDPRGFLRRFGAGAILDEVQRVPELLSYIQGIVDEDGRTGRFVLTGSHNFLLMEKVAQSLAGRTAVLRLLPFSLAELMGRTPLSLDAVGHTLPRRKKRPEDLYKVLFTGFYPRIHDKGLVPQDWLRNYYLTYVERDARSLINVGDIETFSRFVRLCAGRTGQLLNLSSLGADCGISHVTARRWLSLLEASDIVHLLRPHHKSFNKRLVKSPKLYFVDTGLLCYLLRVRSSEELMAHSARGAVFESFVVSELLKTYLNHGREPDMYFWRDSTGHEVDALLDHGAGLVPIEMKSGETVGGDFLKGIDYWRALSGQPGRPAALVYGGEASSMRRGVAIYSWKDWL